MTSKVYLFQLGIQMHQVKKKVVRGNNAPFMNRTLSKAFMHRSKLKNRYHKFPTEANKNSYKR